MSRFPHALIVLLLVGSGWSLPAQTKSIPFDQLGTEAQKQYKGDGIAIIPTSEGARLRTVMQDLEAMVTSEGLWLTSTADEDNGKANRFRVRAMEVRREGTASRIASTGTVHAGAETVTFVRPGLIEEYSVSMDGVRQDFVVLERPSGETGMLDVVLDVTGAHAETAEYGVRLTVSATSRELAYSRLKVTDAAGTELKARLHVDSVDRVRVLVDDSAAVYPVRIDPTFSDADWISMGAGPPGVDGVVNAIVVDGSGNAYIGGDFTGASSGAVLNYIAKWNGSSWTSLGTGMSGSVRSLALSGSTLYAGGGFSEAGGVAAIGVAKWNGSSWSALGVEGNVNAVAVTSDGKVYVGGLLNMVGDSTLLNIARLSGGVWSSIGDLGGTGTVLTMTASGTSLYIGGSFGGVDGPVNSVTASNIALWNGSTWSALGSGVGDPGADSVSAIVVISGGVYAGGSFNTAGGNAANNVARYSNSGGTWSALAQGVDIEVRALALSGSTLFVGGSFTTAGGDPAGNIAKWSGTAWSTMGSGVGFSVNALAVFGSTLYVGGQFSDAGGVTANNIASWNISVSTWSGMATGLNAAVRALAMSGTNLYLGGSFTTAGAVAANHVVKWTGSAWAAMGDGVDADVHALAVSGNDLYVGGVFTTAGTGVANRVAKWNNATSTWSALAEGLNGPVTALALNGADLYVGGTFTTAGLGTANNIAKWNGTAWSALGDGLGDVGTVQVRALAVSGTDLFAGGSFSTADGDPAANIARWNGSAWSALGAGVNDDVLALAFVGNALHAGGDFTQSGVTNVGRVARWDGTTWSALGLGLDDSVHALASVGSTLYAGGEFTLSGATDVSHVARWDGSDWTALGSGTDDTVAAMLLNGNDLYVGGEFIMAGGKSSTYAARAKVAFPSIVVNSLTLLGPTSATVLGTVNPQGNSTVVEIEYGTTTGYGAKVAMVPSPVTGLVAKAVSKTLAGLVPGALYHYRLKATSVVGVSYSGDRTFFLPSGTLAIDAPAGSSIAVLETVVGGQVKIPIIRTGGTAGEVSVVLSTTNGTAVTPSDYTGVTNAAVTLGDGQDELEFPIAIISNGANEPNETFTVKLTGGFLTPGGTSTVTVRIIDNSSLTNVAAPNGDPTPPPTPVISTPALNALVGVDAGATVAITGTATDLKGVQFVEARFVTMPASGWTQGVLTNQGNTSTPYTVNLTPVTGSNTVEVRAIDYAGNITVTPATRVFRVARPLPVILAGDGTVSAGFTNPTSYREVGKSVTITAAVKAASGIDPGSIFTGWTLGGVDVAMSDAPFDNTDAARIGTTQASLVKNSLTFIFREGMTLTANFATNTYPAKSGTYNGLVETSTSNDGVSANSTEGFFNATVQSTGAFSGKLTIDGLVLNVAGLFDAAGVARFGTARSDTVVVARSGKPSLRVSLNASVSPPFKITGVVTQTSFQQSQTVATSMVDASRAHYGTQVLPGKIISKNPAPETVLNIASTAGRTPGELVTGSGIPAGATIQEVNAPNEIVIDRQATAAVNAVVSLTFTRDVPTEYLTVVGANKNNGAFTVVLPPKEVYYGASGTFVGGLPGTFETAEANEFEVGDRILFVDPGNNLPAELDGDVIYHVGVKTGNAFQLNDDDGDPISFSAGSGEVQAVHGDRQTEGYATSDYPQGYGYGTATVTKAGLVTFATTLADGTAATASSTLSQPDAPAHDGEVALFVPLYNKLGFLSGFVSLNHAAGESDMSAADVKWLRPFIGTSHYYPAGWPDVLTVGLKAALFTVAPATAPKSTLRAADGDYIDPLDAEGDGNAALSFGDGALTEDLLKNVMLSPTDVVVKVPVNDPTFTLTVGHATGVLGGTFIHTDDTVSTIKGIIYQKGPEAGGYGFFLTKQVVLNYTGESGWIELIGEGEQ